MIRFLNRTGKYNIIFGDLSSKQWIFSFMDWIIFYELHANALFTFSSTKEIIFDYYIQYFSLINYHLPIEIIRFYKLKLKKLEFVLLKRCFCQKSILCIEGEETENRFTKYTL